MYMQWCFQARKEEARRQQELQELKDDASSTAMSPWSNEPLRRPRKRRSPDTPRFKSEVEFVDHSNLTFPQFLVSRRLYDITPFMNGG